MSLNLKSAVKKLLRAFGVDIVSIKNLDRELEARVDARERQRVERLVALRQLRKQAKRTSDGGESVLTSAEDLDSRAISYFLPASTVLDIGCAFKPQAYIEADTHICCEPYSEYMERLIAETSSNPSFVYLNCDLNEACRLLPKGSVDTVFLLDVIEHVVKHEGKSALQKLQGIARSQVIIFTPLGYMHQEAEEGEKDQWGMAGVEWQKHRSGWLPEDFAVDDGWVTVFCEEYFKQDAYGRMLDVPIGALWAIWTAPGADANSKM